MYNVSVTFGDDTAEILRFVGLPAENAIDVHLTDYKTPRAGIMMITNNGVRHIYILVSTT
jgi:hypothetical protein